MNNAIRSYLKKIGAAGGQSKSPAKVAASKANGKLGGRPRKIQSEEK